jgi:hypothetical protein
VAVPASRAVLASTGGGLAQLVVDLRLRPLDLPEPVLERTASGAMLYVGGLKKSLLQSCPFLVLALAPLWIDLRRGDRRPLLLLLPALGFLGVYSAFAWHGGMALNLRYWTPALPLLAILVAVAIERLGASRRAGALALGGLGAAVPLGAVLLVGASAPEVVEPWLLTAPLVLAAGLLAAVWADRSRIARPALAFLAGASLAWGGVVTHLYDLPWSARQRASTVEMRATLEPLVPEGALLLTPYVVGAGSLAGDRGRIVADPTRDAFEDAPALVRRHLAAGRPVLGLLPAAAWAQWGARPDTRGLATVPLWAGGSAVLARIVPEATVGPGAEHP